MNRRAYLKGILAVFGTGIIAITSSRWLGIGKPFNFNSLEVKHDMLAELVEVIIPTTDTPGAKLCGAHMYILNVLKLCMSEKDQQIFLDGLEDLDNDAKRRYGKLFTECNSEEKFLLVKAVSDTTGFSYNILNKVRKKVLGVPFFTQLRKLTVEGYCLSKKGATEGLAYDYIPGKFHACIPLHPNQKSWATK